MDNTSRVVVVLSVLAAFACSGEGFWYSSSNPNPSHKKSASNGGQWQGPPPPGVYSLRSEQFSPFPVHSQPGQLQYDSNGQPQFVALPLAVPIPAHIHPQMVPPTPLQVQNVQLVPCLCPIAKDVEYPPVAPTPSSTYMGQATSNSNSHNMNPNNN